MAINGKRIHEAQNAAADGDRSQSSVACALLEQTTFATGRVTTNSVLLTYSDGTAIPYQACPKLHTYLLTWRHGLPVQPATFTLTLAP